MREPAGWTNILKKYILKLIYLSFLEPLRTFEINWPSLKSTGFINSKFDNNNKTTFVQIPNSSNDFKQSSCRQNSLYDEKYLKKRKHTENNIDSVKSIDKAKMMSSPEVRKAIEGITYVCDHLRKEDQEKMVI